MSSRRMEIQSGWLAFLKHQAEFYRFESKSRVTVECHFGGWGTGKSESAARKFLKRCVQNPWTSAYGPRSTRPQAVAMAPTNRILRKVTMKKLERVIPKRMIIKRASWPHPYWILANGVEVSFVSAETEFEGEDVFLLWL